MKIHSLVLILTSMAAVACSQNYSTKFDKTDLMPSAKEGAFISADQSSPVPAIILKRQGDSLQGYALLNYMCKDRSTADFGVGGTTFSPEAFSIPMPSISNISEGCEIKTSAIATSADSIEVVVKVNGVLQPNVVLKRASLKEASERIQAVVNSSTKASVDELSCKSVFQADDCASLGFMSH